MHRCSPVSPTQEAARGLRRSLPLGGSRKRPFDTPPGGKRPITEIDLRGQERTPEPTTFREKAKEKPCTLTSPLSGRASGRSTLAKVRLEWPVRRHLSNAATESPARSSLLRT